MIDEAMKSQVIMTGGNCNKAKNPRKLKEQVVPHTQKYTQSAFKLQSDNNY